MHREKYMNPAIQKNICDHVESSLHNQFTNPIDAYAWLKSLTEMQRAMPDDSPASQAIVAIRSGIVNWVTAENSHQNNATNHSKSTIEQTLKHQSADNVLPFLKK